MSELYEINGIDKPPEVTFLIKFNIIDQYHKNLNVQHTKISFFRGEGNNINNLITCKKTIFIPEKLHI